MGNEMWEGAMTVYIVAQVQVQDPEQWEHYKEIAAREIAQHGGRYLARGASPEVEEADWAQPEDLQINIVAFPSLEQAHAWYRSPEYAEESRPRLQAGDLRRWCRSCQPERTG
jgi:uncharacterized protein (DUF1330 family)